MRLLRRNERVGDLVFGAILGAAVLAATLIFAGPLRLGSEFALGVTTGLLSSAFVVLILGIVRSPALVLERGENGDGEYPDGRRRFLHIRVKNVGLRLWRWQLRRPATFCRAEVSFGETGSTAAMFTLDGRWSSLPEPLLPNGHVDAGAIFGRPREFINPDDAVLVCVAIKRDGDTDCFGFNNRSYLYGDGRNPAWRLMQGTYWIRLRVMGAETEAVRVFFIDNNGIQIEDAELREGAP